MNDITELLRAASVDPGELDLERVHRDGRRRQRRPRKALAAAVVLAVVATGTVLFVRDDDGGRRPTISPVTTDVVPTVPSTTTPPPDSTVPSTTPPATTLPAGDDRLSSASRLGYEGLGPIKLGMDFDQAAAAAQVTVGELTGCEMSFYGAPDSGVGRTGVWGAPGMPIGSIVVYDPAIFTISGIHIGSTTEEVRATYPNVTDVGPDSPGALVITNPEGRVIVFSVTGDAVSAMTLAFNLEAIANHARC